MHLPYIFQLNSRIYQKMLFYLEEYLAGYFKTGVLKEVIIGKNAASYGIFDGHYCRMGFFFIRGFFNELPETGTKHRFNIFPEKIAGSSLVKTTLESLDRNFFAHVLH